MDEQLIKHVYGNVMRIAIPLTQRIRTLSDGIESEEEEDFYPNIDLPMTVVLTRGDATQFEYTPEVEGNMLSFKDNGELPTGTYSVTVLCYDDQEQPCRYMVRSKIKVVFATKDAGIEAGTEFDSVDYVLDAAVFFYAKGDKGEDFKMETIDETESTISSLKPNVYHRWGEVSNLTIESLREGSVGVLAEYMIEFRSGSTPTLLSLPNDILWQNGINPAENIQPDKVYQISIINNLGVYAEF